MNYLIKNATIYNPGSKWHQKKCDLKIKRGKIEKIGKGLSDDDARSIEGKRLVVSAGFMDIGTTLSEPGFEELDTINSLCASAAAGGFTQLAVFPNTQPVIDHKGAIETIKFRSANELVRLHPIGALTVNNNGKDISEMEDMISGGAVAFSDGNISVQHAGVLKRALRYLSNKKEIVINHPNDDSLSESGIMNESKESAFLGLKGIPALAEEIMLNRDIELNEYTESTLLSHLVSTKGAVKLLKKAKQKGDKLYASVSFHNLVATDADLKEFDPMHKVIPPLRTKNDVNALIRALEDDTIDCIVSNHVPADVEDKRKAFLYAAFGSLGLEQMFSVLYSKLNDKLPLEIMLSKLTEGPRKILGLEMPVFEEGAEADLVIIDIEKEWVFNKSDIRSSSSNAAFLGDTLQSKVIGVMANKKAFFN